MEINDKIFESKEHKDLVEKVVNFDSFVIKASSYLKENFNVDLEFTEDGDITLQYTGEDINESQQLLDAKAYIQENLDESYYVNVQFI